MPSAPEPGASPRGGRVLRAPGLVGRLRGAAVLAAACALASATGCARQEAPPGAVPESQPPQIRELFPAMDSVVPDLGDAARVVFDEPISARGGFGQQLEGSPAYNYRAQAGHGDIRVQPDEGWRPGAVYVLELDARVSDLLDNAREEPIRWRFSTGPPITGTVVAGRIWDRITGERVQEARALFLAVEGDSIPYTAVTDTGGTFRLEAVPPGSYRAYGFVDRNRNRTLDRRLEEADSASFTLEDSGATARLQLILVEPDSTPPVLGLAEARDSVTVRLTLDDYLRPGAPPPLDSVSIRRKGTDADWPVDSIRVLKPDETGRRDGVGGGAHMDPSQAAAGARDTAATKDTAAKADTVAKGDSLAAPDTAASGDTARASPVGPLPSRSLRVRLGRPLVADTYRVRVRGVQNLQGLTGGGDTLFVYTPPPDTAGPADPANDTVAPGDTTAASDTTVTADTAAADSVIADTAALPREHLRRRDL